MLYREKMKICPMERQGYTVNGYMTVEAALVLSVVMMVYLFLIRSFFWIYDRCVMEQDMAALALRCINTREDMLEEVWQQETGKLDMEKYLWLELQDPLLEKQGWRVTVMGKGENKNMGGCRISYEIWCFTPQDWLRLTHKPMQGTEKGEMESK